MRVPVLMYHGVGEIPGRRNTRYTIAPGRFAQHMRALSKAGYVPISIGHFMEWLGGQRKLPSNPLLLTFDDGYLGVYEYAVPILEEYAWPFTVFLVGGLIGKNDRWVEGSRENDPWHRLLGRGQILEMQAKGVDFQGHSFSHPRLTQLNDEQLHRELGGAKDALEQLLGKRVDYLAYPYGDVDGRVRGKAKEAGYRAAFSTRSGFNTEQTDPFLIRRIEVMGDDTAGMLKRKIALGCNDGSLGHMASYYFGRLKSRLA